MRPARMPRMIGIATMTDFARLDTADDAVQTRGRLIGGLTAFALLLALLVFAVETLDQLGVPPGILVWLVAGYGLAVPAGVAIAARTISRSEFAVAGRTVGAGENAMAGAVAGLGGVFALAIAAAGWRSDQQLIALVLGLAGGYLLGGVLVVPYFRRSGSATPGDFLVARFGSRAVSAIAGLVAALALFPMLVAQLHVAGMIGEWTLGIGSRTAIIAASVLMVLAPLLGGMRGITLSALVQFLFVLPALAATALWIADSVTGSPLSLIAYGLAGANTQGGEIVPGLRRSVHGATSGWRSASPSGSLRFRHCWRAPRPCTRPPRRALRSPGRCCSSPSSRPVPQ